MAMSRATTVDEYLNELPPDRRAVLSAVRDQVQENLPSGYEERMSSGMITYELPLEKYRNTYNGKPLCFAGLAAQKNHFALYLIGLYEDPAAAKRFKAEAEKAGKKLDIGKSCIRFKKLEELPLDVIGKTIASMPPEKFIKQHEKSRHFR